MFKDLVVWFGPVADFQVPGATVPGAERKFFGCYGKDKSPVCSDIAWSFHDVDGRSLPRMVKMATDHTIEETGDIFLGAFSAGGGVVRDILRNEHDPVRIKAIMFSDATYSSAWADKKKRIPIVQDSLIRWCVRLVEGPGDQLFVATASPAPNYNYATGVEVLRELRNQVELNTGQKFEELGHFYGIKPAPDHAYRLGTVILAEYPMEPIGHKHTEIAPQVWQNILLPWLESGYVPGTADPGLEHTMPDVKLKDQYVPKEYELTTTDWLLLSGWAIATSVVTLWFLKE